MSYSILRPPLHKNFWLPSRKQLLRLKLGDNVKLIFQSEDGVERMWVVVTKQQNESEWTGIIDSNAINEHLQKELPFGKEIAFNPLDIIQIPTLRMKLTQYFANKKGRTWQSYIRIIGSGQNKK